MKTRCRRKAKSSWRWEAFDLLLIRAGEKLFAINNACPHLRLPLIGSDLTEDSILVCKFHQSCFDMLTGDIKVWCPGLDPDGSANHPMLKPLGNISKNRTPLTVFPVRVDEGRVWVAFGQTKA